MDNFNSKFLFIREDFIGSLSKAYTRGMRDDLARQMMKKSKSNKDRKKYITKLKYSIRMAEQRLEKIKSNKVKFKDDMKRYYRLIDINEDLIKVDTQNIKRIEDYIAAHPEL